jgi:hypothetical protein
MSSPDAPADATETATICHLAGTLTASECAGDWFYAAEGERWPFRLAVLDERDTGVDERTLLLRGSFEHAGGIADDDLELTICNNDVSGSGSSRFGAYTVVGTVHGDSIQIRKLKDILPKKRRRRSTKKVDEDASRELDRPAKRKKKKKLAARKPPAEGAQLLVKWAGDDGSTREDGRYACVLRGGQLYGDWEEPVPFDPEDVATRVESNLSPWPRRLDGVEVHEEPNSLVDFHTGRLALRRGRLQTKGPGLCR